MMEGEKEAGRYKRSPYGWEPFLVYNLETFNNDVWPAIQLVVRNYAKLKKKHFFSKGIM